jgi:hypothetical protein
VTGITNFFLINPTVQTHRTTPRKQTKEEDTWKIVDLEKKLRFREKDMNLLTKKNFLLK